MAAPAIEYRDVTFSRPRSAPVLDHFSLTVETGDVLALVGRSGAGKTTLLKLVNRLLLPDPGAVFVDGRDTRDWAPIPLRRRAGFVPLSPHAGGRQNCRRPPPGRLAARADRRARRRVTRVDWTRAGTVCR